PSPVGGSPAGPAESRARTVPGPGPPWPRRFCELLSCRRAEASPAWGRDAARLLVERERADLPRSAGPGAGVRDRDLGDCRRPDGEPPCGTRAVAARGTTCAGGACRGLRDRGTDPARARLPRRRRRVLPGVGDTLRTRAPTVSRPGVRGVGHPLPGRRRSADLRRTLSGRDAVAGRSHLCAFSAGRGDTGTAVCPPPQPSGGRTLLDPLL